MLREDGSCNQQINAITPNENYDTDFVYYLVSANTLKIKQMAGSGTMPIVNKETFSNISMDVPSVEEQRKIANCISAFDEVIEDLQKTVNHWKNIKKGLLQQLFT